VFRYFDSSMVFMQTCLNMGHKNVGAFCDVGALDTSLAEHSLACNAVLHQVWESSTSWRGQVVPSFCRIGRRVTAQCCQAHNCFCSGSVSTALHWGSWCVNLVALACHQVTESILCNMLNRLCAWNHNFARKIDKYVT
jgi:hypothetical protein